jgi:hypothetical protein
MGEWRYSATQYFEMSSQLHAPIALPVGKPSLPSYPLATKLCGLQSRSESSSEEKINRNNVFRDKNCHSRMNSNYRCVQKLFNCTVQVYLPMNNNLQPQAFILYFCNTWILSPIPSLKSKQIGKQTNKQTNKTST